MCFSVIFFWRRCSNSANLAPAGSFLFILAAANSHDRPPRRKNLRLNSNRDEETVGVIGTVKQSRCSFLSSGELRGKLSDGMAVRFYSGEDRLDDIRGKTVQ